MPNDPEGYSETSVQVFSPGAVMTASSGNQANTNAVATLTSPGKGQTVYITGFTCTASGATAGLPVNVTITGVVGGTMTFTFTFPAGVLVPATPLVVNFPTPIPATSNATNIVVTLPASGSGGTNAAVVAYGFAY